MGVTQPRIRSEFSRPQLAKVLGEHVWLDDEAQAELGELQVVGLAVWGTAEAFDFMACNAEDYVTDHPELRGSVRDSWVAIARRLRRAIDGLPATNRAA